MSFELMGTGGEEVCVPQPSPSQAGEGWGTRGGDTPTHVSDARHGAPGVAVGDLVRWWGSWVGVRLGFCWRYGA